MTMLERKPRATYPQARRDRGTYPWTAEPEGQAQVMGVSDESDDAAPRRRRRRKKVSAD